VDAQFMAHHAAAKKELYTPVRPDGLQMAVHVGDPTPPPAVIPRDINQKHTDHAPAPQTHKPAIAVRLPDAYNHRNKK